MSFSLIQITSFTTQTNNLIYIFEDFRCALHEEYRYLLPSYGAAQIKNFEWKFDIEKRLQIECHFPDLKIA